MRWSTALFGLFVGTATASCSFLLDFEELQAEGPAASGGAGGSDAAPEIPLDQIASKFAEALCKRVDRCLGVLASAALGDEVCQEYFEKSLGQSVFAGLANLKPERFVYHPDKAPACIAAVEQAECSSFFPIPEACDAALDGLVPEGGDCTHPAECGRGFYCDAGPSVCPGKCKPRPKAGQPCVNRVCAEGLQCEDLADAVVPDKVNPTCMAPAGDQAQCQGGKFASCRLDMTCLGDDSTTPGKCYLISKLFVVTQGLVCNWKQGSLCGGNLHCALTDGNTLDGTCEKPAASGGPCTLSLPDMCPAGEYCNVTAGLKGLCEGLPVEGQNCAAIPIKALCKKGFRCIGRDPKAPLATPGTCGGINGLTDSCTDDELCYSGYCDNNQCKPPNFCSL